MILEILIDRQIVSTGCLPMPSSNFQACFSYLWKNKSSMYYIY